MTAFLALSTSVCQGFDTLGRKTAATSQLNAATNSPLFRRKVVLTSTYPDNISTSTGCASTLTAGCSQSSGSTSSLLHMTSSSSSSQGEEEASQPKLVKKSSNITNGPGLSESLFRKIDEVGEMLKPMALEAREKASEASSSQDDNNNGKLKSIMYTAQSCILFTLFMTYRAYRGFFVLLPAVFREVYAKLELVTMETNPFDEEDDDDLFAAKPLETVNDDKSTQDVAVAEDTKPKRRLRTTVTTSILAGVVTMSYVVGGALRVLTKFIKTFMNSRNNKNGNQKGNTPQHSVSVSFEAAADEMLVNEDKISSKLSNKQVIKATDFQNINGTANNKKTKNVNDNSSDDTNDDNSSKKKGWFSP